MISGEIDWNCRVTYRHGIAVHNDSRFLLVTLDRRHGEGHGGQNYQ